MRTPRPLYAALALLIAIPVAAQSSSKPDTTTAAWWAQTVALSNDSMEGRDTGSEAYERAAKYVADQFKAAGLKPAGDNGTYFQRVPMHQVDLDLANSSISIPEPYKAVPSVASISPVGSVAPTNEDGLFFNLLEQVTIAPREDLPPLTKGEMVFVGYGIPDVTTDLKGKIAVFFNNTPAGLTQQERDSFAGRRQRALTQAGVIATVSIDNPLAIEPFHWPAAYARTVTLRDQLPTTPARTTPVAIRISSEAAANLFLASGHEIGDIRRDGAAGAPLPGFALKRSLRIRIATLSKDISSPNVLAILPGSDPKLAPEYVALSAHLDGYGYGTPVAGDNLYNGTLDDAAYVALLTELAKDLQHKAPGRSLLFCIFTGEEKGLLGSAWFTQHLTVAKESIVANLNLDQLRPIFRLNILTMEGLGDSTLGDTVRTVAAQFKIEIRPDLEPERNLFRRADNYNFVRIGVPVAAFVFGYDKGSPEEGIYRDWYARRYHKPQDDIKTPIDWQAAGKFNRFYTALTLAIANAPTRPEWLPSSPYSPHQTAAK
jgi:Zn-dependent M28 family amino/carboxypeptidase